MTDIWHNGLQSCKHIFSKVKSELPDHVEKKTQVVKQKTKKVKLREDCQLCLNQNEDDGRFEGTRGDKNQILRRATVSALGYFCPKVYNMIWDYFNFFLQFSIAYMYQELSGYVSHISLVLHIYPQEVQEHRLFCSFAWKIRCLSLHWPKLENR